MSHTRDHIIIQLAASVGLQWITEAMNLIGVKEIKGLQTEPEILKLWKDSDLPFTDDETSWCAAFIGGTLERARIRSTRKANARSYEHWGVNVLNGDPLKVPFGSVLVLSRPPVEWHGHVTYAVGYTAEGLLLGLGGNQKDSVSIAEFTPARVIAARWPPNLETFAKRLNNSVPLLESTGNLSTAEA